MESAPAPTLHIEYDSRTCRLWIEILYSLFVLYAAQYNYNAVRLYRCLRRLVNDKVLIVVVVRTA